MSDDDRFLMFARDACAIPVHSHTRIPEPDPLDFTILQRLGGVVQTVPRVVSLAPAPEWARTLLDDGWIRDSRGRCWRRGPQGNTISETRVASGRYQDRAPTNRRRKRERAKAKRRALLRAADPLPDSLVSYEWSTPSPDRIPSRVIRSGRAVVRVLPSAHRRGYVWISPESGGAFCGADETDAVLVRGAEWVEINDDGTAVVDLSRAEL